MDFKDLHFKYIFWFCVGLSVLIIGYDYGITFFQVPEKSVRFADTHSSSFNNILIAIVSFFTGAAVTSISKSKNKEDAKIQNQTDPGPAEGSGRSV